MFGRRANESLPSGPFQRRYRRVREVSPISPQPVSLGPQTVRRRL